MYSTKAPREPWYLRYRHLPGMRILPRSLPWEARIAGKGRQGTARDGKGQPQQHFLSRMPHSVNLSPVGTGSYQDDPWGPGVLTPYMPRWHLDAQLARRYIYNLCLYLYLYLNISKCTIIVDVAGRTTAVCPLLCRSGSRACWRRHRPWRFPGTSRWAKWTATASPRTAADSCQWATPKLWKDHLRQ